MPNARTYKFTCTAALLAAVAPAGESGLKLITLLVRIALSNPIQSNRSIRFTEAFIWCYCALCLGSDLSVLSSSTLRLDRYVHSMYLLLVGWTGRIGSLRESASRGHSTSICSVSSCCTAQSSIRSHWDTLSWDLIHSHTTLTGFALNTVAHSRT